MTEEWGPWIDHDGKGCPCVGMYVNTEDASGTHRFHIANGHIEGPGTGIIVNCWDYSNPLLRRFAWHKRVIRYRIRKPRALLDLKEMIRDPEMEPS